MLRSVYFGLFLSVARYDYDDDYFPGDPDYWGLTSSSGGTGSRMFPLFEQSGCIEAPFTCPNENITYWLYTRSTEDNPTEIDLDNLDMLPYNPKHPWKMIIHGYTGWKDYSPNMEIRPAYFAHGEYNIISVDYGPLVKESCYISAVANVPLVGRCTAQFIDTLVQNKVFRLEELHVIGFSLGAQVSGFIGKNLKSGKLKRLTGLDPAWPLFMHPDPTTKLGNADAEFVDVIHTNMGRKGQPVNCGHVDFYPNGGYTQPGCNDSSPYGSTSSCNHARAPVYFAESIASKRGFWGVSCQGYLLYYGGFCTPDNTTGLQLMGEYVSRDARGSYYLQTEAEPPYAKGPPLEEGDSQNLERRAADEDKPLTRQLLRKRKNTCRRMDPAFQPSPGRVYRARGRSKYIYS